MPITLPPISRRRFIAGSLAVGAAAMARRFPAFAAESVADPNRFILFSDTHVSEDLTKVNRGVLMSENLHRAVAQAIDSKPRPAAVLVNGDCAYLHGLAGDYSAFLDLLKPLREAEFPVHLTLGNHDRRDVFLKSIPDEAGAAPPVEDKHVGVVESPRANWFLLDSLNETNKTPGTLGPAQLGWLKKELESRASKPAVVMVHHNPDEKGQSVSGITDTPALVELLHAHQNVKALIFGHTHDWSIKQNGGIHFINLPPVAYVFADGKPSGWVDVRLGEGGMTLELRSLDDKHPQHGKKTELAWR